MLALGVLVDANVLYSRTIRDWIALLFTRQSAEEFFRIYWTEDILAEVISSFRARHPNASGGQVTRIRDSLAATFAGGRVDDFRIDGTFPGSDEKDRHVHAAAIACGADLVLTKDRDFTKHRDPDNVPYEVYCPDEFFLLVEDNRPDLVRSVTGEQAGYWSGRLGSVNLPDQLRRVGCPGFAERVRGHLCALETIRNPAAPP
ncbi:PIN domain-containing protein [Sciscionella marina]|uniref:PIN domain-containing protein n=1 Tax=Sciscionella marina TaxID=508770 RepID=UPI00047699F6|nr:PIN domain-containing protein [Sciscionella marina]